MFLHHLQLLMEKSIRYAWRRRIHRCCPKIIFEFFIPAVCILLLCLLRWIHTPTSTTDSQQSSTNHIKKPVIHIDPQSIIPEQKSIEILRYNSVYQCPPPTVPIEIMSNNSFNRLQRLCPRSHFILSITEPLLKEHLLLNASLKTHTISYHCQHNNQYWCQNSTLFDDAQDSSEILHPSSYLREKYNVQQLSPLVKAYLSIESLLNRPAGKHELVIFTWPCSSYLFDPLFDFAARFTLIFILILIDGCILFSFNFLLQELIEEKHQGLTELLRLLSIHPLLNVLAWFLRTLLVQLIISVFLIFILKISFSSGIYLSYISIWFIIPAIILWTIQVLSRSILIASFFSTTLKASLWSWVMYFVSFWLAMSSSVRLPLSLHLIISAWLPFYSIKRSFILFFQMNTDLARRTYLINELVYIWFSMIIGSILMWFFAFYFGQIWPGKYGIARPWSWPLDYFRNRKVKKQIRRNSLNKNIIELSSNDTATVRINNLTKTYGRRNAEQQVAVDHISFELENSTIYGLIGHNGAGKTTTMEMLCGLLSCDCGTIEIHNKNLYENLHEIQSGIGYCPQQDMLFSHLTVREQLEFYARVRSNSYKIDQKQIDELLSMMDMNQYNQQSCHTLSGGMQRKLSILCSFVGNVNVIVLDEPSSSLDPVARRILWSWLRKHKANRTLLISSHLLDEVEEICDSVIILDSGRILAQGTVLDLKRRYGPSGDRLHLDDLPSYIPQEWIVDEENHYVQVPNRNRLIQLMQHLEKDNIRYTLVNVTLDDIFIKLISSSYSCVEDENTIKSKINKLFTQRTSTSSIHLWYQQALAVLVRRCQVLIKRARLLPLIICLYLAYELSPFYMPSYTPASERIRYIISSSPEYINKLNLKAFKHERIPIFNSSQEFQQYLLKLPTWSSKHHYRTKSIGLRIVSSNSLECYVPSPTLSNIINTCIPIFSSFSDRFITSLQLIGRKQKFSFSSSSEASTTQNDSIFFCYFTLPPRLHLSIFLISLILIISTAIIIQDYASGLHSYSLVHGLRSSIHWSITFLSDFILCILWLLIIILIARFANSNTFNGHFFALTPLFFITNLPFIYLVGKLFKAPVLGATIIVFILQLAHIVNTFKIFIEVVRGYRTLTIFVQILRWLLLIIFPNVNVFTLIVAILRKSSCSLDDSSFNGEGEEFLYERYPYKIFIHTMIFIIQFILYFILLLLFDMSKLSFSTGKIKGKINLKEEDDDVQDERYRVQSMANEDRQRQAMVVDNLSKYYNGSMIPAVNRLTFALPRRQCFGLLGFNGSGKTTTFRMLVGELRPTGGFIYKTTTESIGYCPQNDIHFSALTVLQSINYICRLHGLDSSLLNDLILSQFQLEKYRHRLVSHLSGGTCRRLHLALCLIGSPSLLLLDEPTAKIDPLLRNHIRIILQHRPIATSIIFASHSMLESEQLCDRITILVRGNAKCLGSPLHLKAKYGTNYRIRLTLLQPLISIPLLQPIENTNEYIYPKDSLAELFKLLEDLVQRNIIASNYTVELTSLEQIFLNLQHTSDIRV